MIFIIITVAAGAGGGRRGGVRLSGRIGGNFWRGQWVEGTGTHDDALKRGREGRGKKKCTSKRNDAFH